MFSDEIPGFYSMCFELINRSKKSINNTEILSSEHRELESVLMDTERVSSEFFFELRSLATPRKYRFTGNKRDKLEDAIVITQRLNSLNNSSSNLIYILQDKLLIVE